MNPTEWRKNEFLISTDESKQNLSFIHTQLAESYWSRNIPKTLVEKAVRNSLCFGVFIAGESQPLMQIGFGRVVSDFTTVAYLCDVILSQEYRGRGLGHWLMECVMAHPELQGLRRFCLGTKDAHGLYRKFGFEVIKEPQYWMEIKKPNIYDNKPI